MTTERNFRWKPHHHYEDAWVCLLDGEKVGGYIDGPVVCLPYVEIAVSIPDCKDDAEARAQVEELAALLKDVVRQWRARR